MIIASVQENIDKLSKTDKTAIEFESGDTIKSIEISARAIVSQIVFTMPSFSGAAVTGTLSIENEDGDEIFSQAGLTEDETHVVIFNMLQISGVNIFKVTLSTDPLSSGTCYISMSCRGA